MSDATRDAGYDDLLDAIEDGNPYYLACPDGHGSLPPRRVCPDCGASELSETPLPESGEIESHTEVHVATPAFAGNDPYVLAIASFGAVRLTGQLRGVEANEVKNGMTVSPTVESVEEDQRLLVFDPR